MKLTELEARWVADFGAPDDAKQGISFLCPHCRARRLAVFFTPTICGRPSIDIAAFHKARPENEHLADEHVGSVMWTRAAGDSFDTLTLTPSIDASKFGCWHGSIANGEVT